MKIPWLPIVSLRRSFSTDPNSLVRLKVCDHQFSTFEDLINASTAILMPWVGLPDTLIYQGVLELSNQQLTGINAGLPLQWEYAFAFGSQCNKTQLSLETKREPDVFFFQDH